jgi:hypothetical protein
MATLKKLGEDTLKVTCLNARNATVMVTVTSAITTKQLPTSDYLWISMVAMREEECVRNVRTIQLELTVKPVRRDFSGRWASNLMLQIPASHVNVAMILGILEAVQPRAVSVSARRLSVAQMTVPSARWASMIILSANHVTVIQRELCWMRVGYQCVLVRVLTSVLVNPAMVVRTVTSVLRDSIISQSVYVVNVTPETLWIWLVISLLDSALVMRDTRIEHVQSAVMDSSTIQNADFVTVTPRELNLTFVIRMMENVCAKKDMEENVATGVPLSGMDTRTVNNVNAQKRDPVLMSATKRLDSVLVIVTMEADSVIPVLQVTTAILSVSCVAVIISGPVVSHVMMMASAAV